MRRRETEQVWGALQGPHIPMHGPPNSVKKTQQQQYLHAIIPLIALRGSHIPRYRYS